MRKLIGLFTTLLCMASMAHAVDQNGAAFGKTAFWGDVSVGSWVAVSNITGTATTGGSYDTTITNIYKVSGTNRSGRLPMSTNVTVVVDGSSTETAALLEWSAYYGLTKMVIERSTNAGVTWGWYVVPTANATSFLDTGALTWQTSNFETVYSTIGTPSVPWGTQLVADWSTNPATSDVNMNGFSIFGIKVDSLTFLDSNTWSSADATRFGTVESGATSNSTDIFLLSRANHTGTQLASTISDFDDVVAGIIATSGIPSANLTGTILDARLSANVPLLDTANIYTANQAISNTAPVMEVKTVADSTQEAKYKWTQPSAYWDCIFKANGVDLVFTYGGAQQFKLTPGSITPQFHVYMKDGMSIGLDAVSGLYFRDAATDEIYVTNASFYVWGDIGWSGAATGDGSGITDVDADLLDGNDSTYFGTATLQSDLVNTQSAQEVSIAANVTDIGFLMDTQAQNQASIDAPNFDSITNVPYTLSYVVPDPTNNYLFPLAHPFDGSGDWSIEFIRVRVDQGDPTLTGLVHGVVGQWNTISTNSPAIESDIVVNAAGVLDASLSGLTTVSNNQKIAVWFTGIPTFAVTNLITVEVGILKL